MGKLYDSLDDELIGFIQRQHVFFVATAPLAGDGFVNLSPKGYDTLRVFGPRTLGYLDFAGSGVETIAHARENGRIVLLFCAFEGPPRILRIHGRAEAFEPDDAQFPALREPFGPPRAGERAILRIEATRIATSCGYGVPLYEFVGERAQLTDWGETKGAEGMREYMEKKNMTSLDGLPGLHLGKSR
ncbi:pyridoxamine 5'-phosphate oxidase family protein [Polyangium mundeleinium]|uniref:Pyridoxamine 5'-phosphate oxidase family protein n=1 Tax=Polyangium mundeleinium TaxID=2995306 RepID=A0ABT5EG82_9BACT|nr:pyridoxamine 5'-phosphate oxidase family protein [Polyangium mundeleinium]MDC0740484.1 pyridoxamine 5'-phosphate oxidase family protein [Polyangium mundeleinium]